jgi:cytochrome P450
MILGVPVDDRGWVAERVLRAFKREPGREGIPDVALGAAEEVRKYFAEMTPGRLEDRQNDLVTVLAGSQNLYDEPNTPEEIGSMCILLFAAGIITTGSFLSTSLHILAEDEKLRHRLVAYPELLPKAVEELWRYESPVQHTVRTCIKDCELGGQLIKAGDRVAVFEGSANRDEDVWENSETLDIDRDFSRNMVFGDGVHVCLGAHLARLEGRIGLQVLLNRIPDYEVAGPIEWTDRPNERGIVSLPVRYRQG